jgi:hypothetical protein
LGVKAKLKVKANLSLCLISLALPMKGYGGVGVYIHVFLTSALDVSGRLHAPAALPPEKEHTLTFG